MTPGIARSSRWKGAAFGARSVLLLALGAFSISCSEIATKPRALAQVSGLIQDRDGAPIEGVTVHFYDRGDPPLVNDFGDISPTTWTTTGQDGSYSIQVPASVYDVEIRSPKFSGYPWRVDLPKVALGPGEATVNHRYGGVRVTGRMIGPGGAALTYGDLYVNRQQGPPYTSAQARLRDGSFSILVPAGTYSFDADPTPANPGVPQISTRNVELASDTTIDLSLDGLPVSGTVFGPGGAPLGRDVTIHVRGQKANCMTWPESDGQYLLHVPQGEYEFALSPGGASGYIVGRQYSGVIVTASQTLDFDLSGVEWTGTVRHTTTNQPVPSASISVRGTFWEFSSWVDNANTIADGAGQFRLVVRRYGLYDIYVGPNTYFSQGIERVEALNDSTFDLYVEP